MFSTLLCCLRHEFRSRQGESHVEKGNSEESSCNRRRNRKLPSEYAAVAVKPSVEDASHNRVKHIDATVHDGFLGVIVRCCKGIKAQNKQQDSRSVEKV